MIGPLEETNVITLVGRDFTKLPGTMTWEAEDGAQITLELGMVCSFVGGGLYCTHEIDPARVGDPFAQGYSNASGEIPEEKVLSWISGDYTA